MIDSTIKCMKVKDFIEYLNTLDPEKEIYGEYVYIIGSKYIGLEKRPFLTSLIEEENNSYKINAMFY